MLLSGAIVALIPLASLYLFQDEFSQGKDIEWYWKETGSRGGGKNAGPDLQPVVGDTGRKLVPVLVMMADILGAMATGELGGRVKCIVEQQIDIN